LLPYGKEKEEIGKNIVDLEKRKTEKTEKHKDIRRNKRLNKK
jgi:hypothetical protein